MIHKNVNFELNLVLLVITTTLPTWLARSRVVLAWEIITMDTRVRPSGDAEQDLLAILVKDQTFDPRVLVQISRLKRVVFDQLGSRRVRSIDIFLNFVLLLVGVLQFSRRFGVHHPVLQRLLLHHARYLMTGVGLHGALYTAASITRLTVQGDGVPLVEYTIGDVLEVSHPVFSACQFLVSAAAGDTEIRHAIEAGLGGLDQGLLADIAGADPVSRSGGGVALQLLLYTVDEDGHG